MFLVRCNTALQLGNHVTADDVTDLIEAIVDTLDAWGVDPSVGTEGTGHTVRLGIELTVNASGPIDAMARTAVLLGEVMEVAATTVGPVEVTELSTLTSELVLA